MTRSEDDRARRFDALFAAHSPDIVAYCGWRAANADDAQDAVSEVFLAAWRRLDELPGGDAARVWLYACARRGTRTSAWTYTVAYSNLGHTPAPVAPPNALTRDQLRQRAGQGGNG